MVQQHAARQRGTDFRHVGFLGPQPAVLWWSQLSGGIHVSIMILDSMSVLQAKHLSAQPAHGTTYVSVLEEALKNVFDCAKKGHFLCFAGFLERAAAAYFFFLRSTGLLMEVCITCYEHVYCWQKQRSKNASNHSVQGNPHKISGEST